jgi:cullin 3
VLEVSIEEQTNRLSAAIKQIQNFQSNKLSYEELYRYAYNIVLHKKVSLASFPSDWYRPKHPRLYPLFRRQGEDLYRTVKSLITSHLVDQANDLILPVFPRSPIIPPSPSSSSSSSAAAISSSTIKGKGKASTSAGAAAAGGIGAGSSMLGSEMSALERGTEGEVFLKALRRVWEDHKSCMAKLRDVLKYMVRFLLSFQAAQCSPSFHSSFSLALFLLAL